jgi:hypothetical protein
MCWRLKSHRKSVTEELAVALSSFNIPGVESLLSDTGRFAVQNENSEIAYSGKENFIDWLRRNHSELNTGKRIRRKMKFQVIQSMHSITDSEIILFEDGRFPVPVESQAGEEKGGLIVSVERNKITGIRFCILKMKTRNPFIYEKKTLGPVAGE